MRHHFLVAAKAAGRAFASLVLLNSAHAQPVSAPNRFPSARFLADHAEYETKELSSGVWISSAVTGPEVRRFSIRVAQGQFAAVSVKQLSGNLVVSVFDPRGKLVALEDRSGKGGREVADWVATDAGQYAVQVAMFEWDAPQARFEIALSALALAGQTPDDAAAQIFDVWHEDGYPGGALAIIDGGKIRLRRTAGQASLSPEQKIDSSTKFELASVSKQFTGLAVAKLIERGKIALDQDIRTHLPEMPDYGVPITIRHLLTHTSGLRDWDAGLGLAGRPIESGVTLPEILAFAVRQPALNFPPGAEQNYSNTNYSLLAEIVARTSGVPFERFLADEIFAPSGMSAVAVADPNSPVSHMAQSFQGRFPAPELRSGQPTSALGSSSVYASLDDMIAWVQTLRKTRAGGARGAWAQFLAPGGHSGEDTYDFGLWRGARQGVSYLRHLGLAAGYRISFRWFPERDLAIIYMTNDGDDATYGHAQRLEDLYLGHPPTDVIAPDAEYEPASSPPSKVLAQYAGKYTSDELNTAYEIAVTKTRLAARHPINGEIALNYESADTFSSSFPYMPTVTFRRNSAGAVDAMVVSTDSARNMVFRKAEAGR